MKIKHFLTTIFLAATLVSCNTKSIHINPDPGPVPVIDTDWCEAADVNIEKLQCFDRAGEPMWINKLGERFAQTCRRVQDEGGVFLNPRCVATAASCDIAMKCPASFNE
jgi:hypothetical protein